MQSLQTLTFLHVLMSTLIQTQQAVVEVDCIYNKVQRYNYIVKQDFELELHITLVKLEIHNNTAQYGGGIFVADSTESGACRGEDETIAREVTQTECFIQTLNLHGTIFLHTD